MSIPIRLVVLACYHKAKRCREQIKALTSVSELTTGCHNPLSRPQGLLMEQNLFLPWILLVTCLETSKWMSKRETIGASDDYGKSGPVLDLLATTSWFLPLASILHLTRPAKAHAICGPTSCQSTIPQKWRLLWKNDSIRTIIQKCCTRSRVWLARDRITVRTFSAVLVNRRHSKINFFVGLVKLAIGRTIP
jgi:hypothetical protein